MATLQTGAVSTGISAATSTPVATPSITTFCPTPVTFETRIAKRSYWVSDGILEVDNGPTAAAAGTNVPGNIAGGNPTSTGDNGKGGSGGSDLSSGGKAGIAVIIVLTFILVFLSYCCWRRARKNKSSKKSHHHGQMQHPRGGHRGHGGHARQLGGNQHYARRANHRGDFAPVHVNLQKPQKLYVRR